MNFMQANVSGDDDSDIIAITLCGLFPFISRLDCHTASPQ